MGHLRYTHVVLLDRTPDFPVPHLLPVRGLLLLGIRFGLSLAIFESVQFLETAGNV